MPPRDDDEAMTPPTALPDARAGASPPDPPPPRRRRRWPGLVLLGLIVTLLILIWAGVRWIDSPAGHRFVAERIADWHPKSGLHIQVGSIQGSIFKQVELNDVRLSDPQGEFARIQQIDLHWYPLGWFSNRLDIDWLHIGEAWLDRLPKLKSSGNKPILPGFDIRLMDLRIDRLHLGKALAGVPHVAKITGDMDVRSGRAVVDLAANSLDSGDAIRLALDSRPADNRFAVNAAAAAPKDGIFAHLLGVNEPMALALQGGGDWTLWRGQFVALAGNARIASVAITQRKGRYQLKGPIALLGQLKALGARSGELDADLGFADRTVSGTLRLGVPGLALSARGGVDLGRNRFDDLRFEAAIEHPARFSAALSGQAVRLKARLAGPFDDISLDYLLTAPDLRRGPLAAHDLRLSGEGRLTGKHGTFPLHFSAGSLATGAPPIDQRLRDFSGSGVLRLDDGQLALADASLRANGFSARLDGTANSASGALAFKLAGGFGQLTIPGLGQLDLTAALTLNRPAGGALALDGTARAQMQRLDSGFLHGIAGGPPLVTSQLALDGQGQVQFRALHLVAPSIDLTGQGYRARDGTVHLTAQGTHHSYGPVKLALDGDISRPRVDLQLEKPLPALGLRQVHALLLPDLAGYQVSGTGGSPLGPFTVAGAVLLPADATATINVTAIKVSDVTAAGQLLAVPGGLSGVLKLSGPADGQIAFAVKDAVQTLGIDMDLSGAQFDGPPAMSINRGAIHADVTLRPDATGVDGQLRLRGVRYGTAQIGQLAARLNLVNGQGKALVSMRADRGRLYDLQAQADIAPGRLAVQLHGTVDHQPITLDAPAVLTSDEAGWELAPTTLRVRDGALRLSGKLGVGSLHVQAQMQKLPLSLLDLVNGDLGLGGSADGTFSFNRVAGQAPTGKVSARIHGLTRAGLALSSRPIDLGVNAVLTDDRAAVRAVMTDGKQVVGRAQALVTPLGSGTLAERLNHAPLRAQLRYAGSADTLWRLTNVEILSLGGDVTLSADVGGTLADPKIAGQLDAKNASLQSPATGMMLKNLRAHGEFNGSDLTLNDIYGETSDHGTVTGTARIGFSAARGVGLDVKLQAKHAVLLDRDDVGATVTGPIRLQSDGNGGVISGDLKVESSRFTLGQAAAVAQIPQIRLVEINRSSDEALANNSARPWTLDIKADAPGNLQVEGLGMQSVWSARLKIGGDVTSPAFTGTANLIRGDYDFAGKRFDLREGRLTFHGQTPVNPTLDIRAVADVSSLNATITVTGSSLRPIINFSSVPAMPQEELLAQILFGTSVTNLSAPEAIQLASAVAAFQGGNSGLDPINSLRRAIGLSRLRILPANTTTGQKTSIAAGKNITRNLYVELITDGQGYSATTIEFQITRWLSLISSVSTIGRQSLNARISKDY